MILALLLGLVALAFLLWMLVACATHATSLAIGVLAGLFAYRTGAGWLGAPVVGFIAVVSALAAARLLMASRSRAVRIATTVFYSAPAGIAGYHAIFGITAIAAMSEGWRSSFAGAAALLIAYAAVRQLLTAKPVSRHV